jgi:hypothetical protein
MDGMNSTSSLPMLSRRADPRHGVERYLGPDEQVIWVSRRHIVALDSGIAVWITATVFSLAAGLASRGHSGWYLGQVGVLLFLAGTAFLGCKTWMWWSTRYVFTNDRVLLIGGVLSRRVNGLPLRAVLDTTYRRSIGGRVRGYGDLELNMSGQPGLRKLTSLPNPDNIYQLILSLIKAA